MNESSSSKSVRGVILRGNEVFVEHFAPKNIFFLPGGRVEEGEELTEALMRELHEEVKADSFEIGECLGKIEHRLHFGNCMVRGMNYFYQVNPVAHSPLESKEEGRTLRWLDLYSEEAKALKPPILLKLLLERFSMKDSVELERESPTHFEQWDYVDSEEMGVFAAVD